MKKILSLLALLVAAVSSAWAGDVMTYTLNGDEVSNPAGFFTHDTNGKFSFNSKFTDASYDGIDFTSGLKMEGTTKIMFTTTVKSKVIIVQSDWSTKTIKFDDTELAVADAEAGTGCRIYTINDVAAGDHTITRGSGESGIFYVKVEYTEEDTTPSLSASPKTIALAANALGRTRTGEFSITGKNLTDGTYDLTVPSVAGLSVSPASFTVSGGAVMQNFTVEYYSEDDVAKNTIDVVATVDGIDAVVAVTYQSRAKAYEQTIVSGAAEWDWTTLKETVTLSGSTIPTRYDEFVFRELDDLVDFGSFDAQSILISNTEYPVRAGVHQNGTIKFKTSVPGTVKVDFSDTGSSGSGSERYLVVNGNATEYYTMRDGTVDRKVSGEIAVPSGEVSITGTSAICIYKVTFTPSDEEPIEIVCEGGLASYSNAYNNLDFSTSSATAYIVTAATSSGVTLEEVTTVPKGAGIIIKGGSKGDNIKVKIAASAPALTGNLLVGTGENGVVVGEGEAYALSKSDGKLHPVKEGATIGAGKAYLPAEAISGTPSSVLDLDFGDNGETTGVSEKGIVNSEKFATAPIYDLQGRKVSEFGTRNSGLKSGFYIVNGKKVIIK